MTRPRLPLDPRDYPTRVILSAGLRPAIHAATYERPQERVRRTACGRTFTHPVAATGAPVTCRACTRELRTDTVMMDAA